MDELHYPRRNPRGSSPSQETAFLIDYGIERLRSLAHDTGLEQPHMDAMIHCRPGVHPPKAP